MGQDQLAPHRVVVYTKSGCGLCRDALALLKQLRAEFDLTIEETDIEKDAALFKRYFEKIPVLVIDGRRTLAAPITADAVRSILQQG